MIPITTVEAHPNPEYPKVSSGNATSDKIFLLSIQEVNKYLTTVSIRTEVSANDNTSSEWWWLRTLGNYQFNVTTVSHGRINYNGCGSTQPQVGVRPAMWINTN